MRAVFFFLRVAVNVEASSLEPRDREVNSWKQLFL